MDVRPNVGQLEDGPEVAVGNDERRGYITPEIYYNQFWLDHVQIGKACRIAVDTAVCAAVLEPNPEGLESYINSTFNISDQQKKNIEQFSISRQGKTCRLILSCRVIKALRLAPINATEKSNPYIILGVIPSRCIGDKVTKHGLLREGQEDGLVGNIFRSRTQLSTLQPSWNEQFDIPLQDRDNDTLVIEMWNSKEPAVPNISQVKDQKGIAKFFGNHKSNDSLIGRTYCDAKGVHLIGNEMSLDLIEAFDRHKCGSITIHLSIRVKSEHHTEVLMDESHGLLYKALVMKESEQLSKCRQEKFPSILSNHGEELLHLHASYNGLSKLHEYSVRLSALLCYHKTCPFLPSVFKPIVDTLIVEYHLFCEDKLAVENHNSECQSAWIKEILNQFQALLDESKKVLCDHLTMIDLSNAPGLQVLEDYVLLLVKLYTIDDLVGRLPSEEKSIQNVMSTFIKRSFEAWFSKSIGNQDNVVILRDTMWQCLSLCNTSKSKIGPIIQKHIGVDYFTIFIVTMDGLLSMHTRQLCNRDISQDEQLANILQDIYFLLKDINDVRFLSITVASVHGELQVPNYQSWFRPIIPTWLQNISNICNTKISRSVDLDVFSTSVTKEVKFSSSSYDTLTFLHEMKEFWGKLHWPPCEDTFSFYTDLANYIIQGALNYVDKVFSVWPQYFRSINATQVNVTQQLCVLISNIEHICEELRPTPTSSSSEKKLWTIELDPGIEQTTSNLWQQTKSTIQSNFQQASDSCHKRILSICEQIGHQFEPAIVSHIKDLVKPNPKQDIFTYMDTNLTCLRTNLLDHTFNMILANIWTSVIRAFGCGGFRNDCLSTEKYSKIKDTLLDLHRMFQGEGNGLTGDQLDTEEYKALVNEMQHLSQPTHDLVLDFCADLARQQAQTSPDGNLGTIGLSVGYIKSQSVLEVTIVGSNLNCNGSLYLDWDILPRISTRTKPRRLLNTQKTSDKKQNFSEEFKLSLNEDMMRTEGSVVILGLHNQKKDGLIGICIVPCKDIPTVTTDAGTLLNDHGSSRMRCDLALFQVKESKTIQELEHRRQKSDHDASVFLTHFCKKYMHSKPANPASSVCNMM